MHKKNPIKSNKSGKQKNKTIIANSRFIRNKKKKK